MAEMYLTNKLLQHLQFDGSPQSSQMDQTSSLNGESMAFGDGHESHTFSARTSNKHLHVEELEMLLEAYFVQIDRTLNNISTVNPKVVKLKKRKNWGKSNIQLVAEPVEPLPPQPNEALGSDEMPLRLPRAMETISLESHPPPPFTDRNSVRNDESLNRNMENRVAVVPPRSDEKENRIL